MASIYIHIPFCRKACSYCNFYFTTSLKNENLLIDSILKEIELKEQDWNEHKIDSIYFGGGTPSLVNPNHINKIIKKIRSAFPLDSKTEITLEVNPEDVEQESVSAWLASGINRISMGVQSFFDHDLTFLGRVHDAKKSHAAIETLKKNPISSISIDLIYGIPTLTNAKWLENLNYIKEYELRHFSAYALTIEEQTLLYHQLKNDIIGKPDEALYYEQFELLRNWIENNVFEQYEVSNFARDGQYSLHNSAYWQHNPYMGLGPAAHSFDGKRRSWNIASTPKYCKSIRDGNTFTEFEELSKLDLINEYIMLGLRCHFGVDLSKIQAISSNALDKILTRARKYFSSEIKQIDNKLLLDSKHYIISDYIIEKLILNENEIL